MQSHNRKHILEQAHLEKLTSEKKKFLRSSIIVAALFWSEYLPFKKSFIKCIENFQSLALRQIQLRCLIFVLEMPLKKGCPSLCRICGVSGTKGRERILSSSSWWPLLDFSNLSCQRRWALKREPCLSYSAFSIHRSWSFETLRTNSKCRFFSLPLSREALTHLETRHLYCSQTPQKASGE